MAALAFAVLIILAMPGHSSANWCVCREDVSSSQLQKTLDYACGAGADCGPIHQNGPCYNPDTVKDHCSYATNSYFQKHNQGLGTCDFGGTTRVVTADPSSGGTCIYPATPQSAGGITTNPITTPSTAPGTTGTPISNTPYGGTPSNGIVGGGMSPSMGAPGAGMNTDIGHGGLMLRTDLFSFFIALLFSVLGFVWG